MYSAVITSSYREFTGGALTANRLIVEPEDLHFEVFKCKLLRHL